MLCELNIQILYKMYCFVHLLSRSLCVWWFEGTSDCISKCCIRNCVDRVCIGNFNWRVNLIKNFKFDKFLCNFWIIVECILIAIQLLIFYWSLVVWIAYVNFKFWIDEVFDLIMFGKDCLFAKVFDYAMRFNVICTSHSKISHCDALMIFAMHCCILRKELFLKEVSRLFLIGVVYNMIWSRLS